MVVDNLKCTRTYITIWIWIIINCRSLNTVYMSYIVYLWADNVTLAILYSLVLIYLPADEDVVVLMKSTYFAATAAKYVVSIDFVVTYLTSCNVDIWKLKMNVKW